MRHRFHSLCPYFAMFPESFAERWIARYSKPGQVILDPFCGRGTTPFQALLMGRRAIACDTNTVAYCVTRAKTNAPALSSIRRRITQLEHSFIARAWSAAAKELPQFFHWAFSAPTLAQLVYLRESLAWRDSDTDCMVAALALGALHGEVRDPPAYMSNQMPRTISTKPDYSVRYWRRHRMTAPRVDAFELLRAKASFRYESEIPRRRGSVFYQDMRDLPRIERVQNARISCVVTSPPYLNVTNFEEDQWLRGWFLGGTPYPQGNLNSRDDRYRGAGPYWNMITDLWRTLGQILADNSHVVIRMGGHRLKSREIVDCLVGTAVAAQRKVRLVLSEVSEIRRRQTDAFRPGSEGCREEVDVVFHFA